MSNIAQSPEAVAVYLLENVMIAESKKFSESDRKYLLDTYAECLGATMNQRAIKP